MNCQRELFQLPENQHYINCSFLSPMLYSVEKAVEIGLKGKREPWTIKPEHFFEDSNLLRSEFAALINAPDANQIAIMPAVSYGMGIVSKNLPVKTGGNIVVAGEQFPSNVYPWMNFCKVNQCTLKTVQPPSNSDNRGEEWNSRIKEAINKNTMLVAIANVHWTDGTRFDVEEIGKLAREKGAWFVIDGTQSVGALPFDVQKVQPDALICAGYKWLMGPYGTTLGYFGPRLLDGRPLEEGWIVRKNSRNFKELIDYEDEYEPGALRFDVGERSNFLNTPMMLEAVKQVNRWTPEAIQLYCKKLCSEMIPDLKKNGFTIETEARRSHHMFGIRLPERIDLEVLRQSLSENNIHVSVRGTAVRVSPHLYNNANDIEKLRDVLIEM